MLAIRKNTEKSGRRSGMRVIFGEGAGQKATMVPGAERECSTILTEVLRLGWPFFLRACCEGSLSVAPAADD